MTAVLPTPAEIIDELVIESAWSIPTEAETPFDEVCKLLDRLLRIYGPEYVYPEYGHQCHYLDLVQGGISYEDEEMIVAPTTEFKPSCLVGAILTEVKDTESLACLWESNNDEGLMNIVDYFPAEWQEDWALMQGLLRLQSQQDVGMPWGDAVAEFKEHYPHLSQLQGSGVCIDTYWAQFPVYEIGVPK